MLEFSLKILKPSGSHAWLSAVAMGLSYFIGGLIPMIPYFATPEVDKALFASIGITVVVLLAFGFVKTYASVTSPRAAVFGAVQTLFIGGLAAATSYGIVRAVDSHRGV